MSEPVPIDQIKWVKQRVVDSWTQENIMAMNPNGSHGYILECDLEVPENIHETTSEYPLCPESLTINQDLISPKSWLVIGLVSINHIVKLTLFPFSYYSVCLLV